MSYALVLAEQAALSGADIRAASSLPDALIDGDRILVEIWHESGEGRAQVFSGLAQLGAEIRHAGDEAPTEAWVPAARMTVLAAIPGVHRVTPARLVKPMAGSQNSQGVAAGNAPPWHTAGLDGDGVTIAIIDIFNNTGGQMVALQGSGDWPPNSRLTTVKVGGGTFGNNGVDHGNAVLEIAYDVAPGATFIAYDTLTLGDWRSAIQQAVAAGADVISASLGAPRDGIGDGTALPGSVAQRVEEAAAAGVLYLNAAGNERESHWGGLYAPSSGSANFLTWSGTNQQINYFGPGTGAAYCIPNGFPLSGQLFWNDWTNVDHDYDLRLYEYTGTGWVQRAQSILDQNGGAGQTPQEFIDFTANSTQAATCGGTGAGIYGWVVVRFSAATNRNLQFFASLDLDRRVPARSLGFPADSPAALTVAAIDVTSSVQELYSSEGPILAPGGGLPTGTEFPKPDFSSYANVDTVSYGPGVFNGTSAAAPHAAGMAALLMQRHPGFNRDQIAQRMREISLQGANDLGAAGFDFQHGHGRLRFQQESALVVTEQPQDTDAGVTMASVSVEVRDTQNLPVLSGPTQSVGVAIGNDPSAGAANLSGTSPIDLVLGEAEFSDLAIDTAGVGYTFQFTAGLLTPIASAAFDIFSVSPVSWTVTPSAGTNGSIAPSTPQSVVNGDTVAFTLTPDTGYSIDAVGGTCGGALAGNIFTTNAVTGNCTVAATFMQNAVNGVCGPANGGTFTTAPITDLCDAGTATPVSGSGPWAWACEGVAGGATAMCSANIQTYPVTAVVQAGNGSIGPANQSVAHGGTASGSVSADAGWSFDALLGDTCTPVADGLGGWSAANITAACGVTAAFTQDPIDGVCGAADGGTFTTAPSADLCNAGTAGPVTGSGPWTWACEGIAGGATAMCSANVQTYPVTAALQAGNGSIGPANQSVAHGGTASGTVSPDAGWSLMALAGDTCVPIADGLGGWSAANITAACAVTASFMQDAVNGVCGPANGGTFTTAPITDLCDAGDPSAVSGDGPWTWACEGIAGGATAMCSANIQTYPVTAAVQAGNGSIGPANQSVAHGGTASGTVSPDAGWSLMALAGDTCVPIADGLGGWSAANITAACAVTASFMQDAVNGVCGPANGGTFTTAPITDLCDAGDPSAVSGDGPWTWACEGIAGGATAMCSANIQTYPVTAAVQAGNGSIGPANQSVAHGGTASGTVAADSGWSLIFMAGDTCTPVADGLGGWSATNITAACAVTAIFLQDVVNGVCGAAHGGTFTTAPTTDLCDAGDPTAVSGDGPWTWACEGVAGGATTMCSANIQTYPVTAAVQAGSGSIGPANQSVAHGGAASGTVSADAGWSLDALAGDTCSPIADGLGGWSAASITAACAVTATFTQDPIDGVCGAADGGTFTTEPTTDLCDAGTATPVTGSGPWAWSCEGIAGGSNATCSADIQAWTLTYTAGTGGSISGTNPQTVNHGTDGSPVEAQPDLGYSFVQWSDSGTDNPRTDTNVTGDIAVEAEFALQTYVVTTTAVGGTITSTINPEIDHGQTAIVTGQADVDQYFSEVSGCGGVVQTNSDQSVTVFNYETGAITAACEVTAFFLIRTETSTLITGIDPSGSQTVGQSYEVSIAVNGMSPSGTVSVSDGDANCGITLDAAGLGSCDLISTTVGPKSITASYAGDGTNDPSDAAPVPYDIVRIETSITDLDADSGYPDFHVGDTVTFTWTLDSASSFGTLDGNVSVSAGGSELCAALWSEGACAATLATGGPAVEFEFSYPGNTWYAPSDNQMTLEVFEDPREITLDASIGKRVLASLVLLDDGGDLVRFELLVSNVGGDPIVGAEVVDMLPVEMVASSWTCEELAGGECANASGSGDIDELVNLPLGASVRFLVEGLLDTVPEKGVVNTALVVAADDVDDSNNASGAVYQRCAVSNLQSDIGDETLLEHACVFRDGYEAE